MPTKSREGRKRLLALPHAGLGQHSKPVFSAHHRNGKRKGTEGWLFDDRSETQCHYDPDPWPKGQGKKQTEDLYGLRFEG